MFTQADVIQRYHVIGSEEDVYGTPVWISYYNPLINTHAYEVCFVYVRIQDYIKNITADNLNFQGNSQGHECLILHGIVEHKYNGMDENSVEGCGSDRYGRKTTKGLSIIFKPKYGTSYW